MRGGAIARHVRPVPLTQLRPALASLARSRIPLPAERGEGRACRAPPRHPRSSVDAPFRDANEKRPLAKNGRSLLGPVAWQFITDLAGRLGQRLEA